MTLRAVLRRMTWMALALVNVALLLLVVLALVDVPTQTALRRRIGRLDDDHLGGILHRLRGGWTASGVAAIPPPHRPGAYAWLLRGDFLAIAHGLGPVLSAGPNSLAALIEGLAQGFTVFEVDLALTTDDHLVCYHGESDAELERLTLQRFRQTMSERGMHPCEFSDLVTVARRHPDVLFVLDPKDRVLDTYRLVRAAVGDPELGHQFIPQIYAPEEAALVRREGFFAGEIFTSYRSRASTRQILDWARRADVRAVTLTLQRAEDLGSLPRNPAILVHPVDVPSDAVRLRELGARGIYTYYLSPRLAWPLYAPWTSTCRPPRRFGCDTAETAKLSRPRRPE